MRRGTSERAAMIGVVGAAVAVLVVFAAACAPAPGASPSGTAGPATRPSAVPSPVVLVPGWEIGCVADPTDWDRWRDAFVGRGLREDLFVVVHYNSCQSNLDTADMIGDAVDAVLARSGADHVELIAHSMGALSARWCVRFGRCAGRVDQVVTLAGANHGTVWATACFLQFWARSCADMTPGSAMLRALNDDETPDGIGWETWVSPCELTIVPRESAFLDGAVNHDLVDSCVDHSGWKRHQRTIDTVADRLVGTGVDAPGPSDAMPAAIDGAPGDER